MFRSFSLALGMWMYRDTMHKAYTPHGRQEHARLWFGSKRSYAAPAVFDPKPMFLIYRCLGVLPCFLIFVSCLGLSLWFHAMVSCFGVLPCFLALLSCIGVLPWFPVLVSCITLLFWLSCLGVSLGLVALASTIELKCFLSSCIGQAFTEPFCMQDFSTRHS